jgi:hypothetical protein
MVASQKGRVDMSSISPSTNRLPSVTTEKLYGVCRRRKTLITLRALAIALAVFLAVLLLAALIDKWWNITDQIRWSLSGTIYGVAAMAAAISLYPYFRPWGFSEAANLIEQFVPSFKNRMQSAVDLAVESDDPKYGSKVLRERLLQSVADQMGDLRITDVLPWKRIRSSVSAFAMTATSMLILCLIPQWQLPLHIMRMLLPAANIARPSLAEITLLSPEKSVAVVPLNERLLIRAAIEFKHESDRRLPRNVQVQWRSPGSSNALPLLAMAAEGTDAASNLPLIYSTTSEVIQQELQYRIVSDVGETRWYDLQAYPRPKVEKYFIEVQTPGYAQTPPASLEAVGGDVEVLEGSQVTWSLKPTVSLSKATLRWLDVDKEAGEKEREELALNAVSLWSIAHKPTRTRRFQVDLVSEQGIESTFPITYRVTVRQDQPPKLAWLEPKQSARVIRPRSAAKMVVAFQDEFPLQSMEQWTRINRGDWSKRNLDFANVADGEVSWIWELANLGLQLGDLVDTKVVAIDRNGKLGESASIEWVISGTELDASRELSTLAREQIADAFAEFAATVKKAEEKFTPFHKAWHQEKTNVEKEKELLAELMLANETLLNATLPVRDAILQRMTQVDNLVSREELVQALDVLALLEKEALVIAATKEGRLEKERLQSGNSQRATEQLDQWEERLLQTAQRLNEAYRRMVPHDVFADLGRDLQDGSRYQQELLRDTKQVGEEIWNREQRVLATHLRTLAQEMLNQTAYVPDGPSKGLSDWAGWAEQMAEKMDSFCEQNPPVTDQERKQRFDEIDRMAKELQYRERIHQTHSGLGNELIAGRREMIQMAGRPNEILTKAIQEWQANRQHQLDPALLPEHFSLQLEQYARRREGRHARGDFAGRFAADLGLAQRAITHQSEFVRGDVKKTEEVLQIISECVAILETEYRLRNVQKWLEQLQEEERFAANGGRAITENPRIWDSWNAEIEMLQDYVRRSNLGNEVADALNGLRWSPESQAVGQKISSRRWEQKPAVSASSELDTLQFRVDEQAEKLAAKFAEARDRLQQLAPTIPELAKEAAQIARAEQRQTEQLNEEVKQGSAPNVPERLIQNETAVAEEKQLGTKQLQEALEDLAASQDLLDSQQLSKAKAADLASALQQQAQARTEEALEKAKQAENAETSPALEQLSKSQEKEAQTLEAIAAHFEQDPLSESTDNQSLENSQLAQMAQQLDAQPNPTAFDEAERLAQLAEADPRELLRRLEQELASNQEMQEELSDIAQNLAEQSQSSLAQAAEREKAMRSSVLQSDPLREPRRQEMAQELNLALDQANRLAQRIAQEAQSQAGLGKQDEEKKQLQQLANDLYKSIDTARQQASSQLPEDMKQAAEQLNQALQNVQPPLQDASQKLAQGKQEQQFDDANKLLQARNHAERTQSQLHEQDQRNADQNVKLREQRKQAAERNVQQAQQQLTQAERQRDQVKEQANKDPQNEYQKNVLADAEARVLETAALKALAEQAKGQAEQKFAEAQQRRSSLDNKPGTLEAPSPNSELSERLTQQVAQRASELSQGINQMLAESTWIDQVEASRSQLAASASQQQTVQETVSDAARDLDRAAAHQERLNAPQSAKMLAEAAQRVDSTARKEAQNAGEQLRQAGNPEGESNRRYASADDTREATEALKSSQNAIEQRAKELGEMLTAQNAESAAERGQPTEAGEPKTPPGTGDEPKAEQPEASPQDVANKPNESQSGSKGQNQDGSPNAPTKDPSAQMSNNSGATPSGNNQSNATDSPLSPREMAEMLDELDRQLRDPSGAIQPDSMAQPATQAGAESLSSLRKPQQQVAQQLQQMRSPSKPLNNPTMVVTSQPSQAKTSQGILIPNPNGSGTSKVFSTDQLTGEPLGAWSRLREKKSDEVVESQREAVAPRYRRQIENYFKTLSERSVKQ